MTNLIKLDFSHIAAIAPPRPNKFDIIPIHNSDRAAFKFCRRQWAWSSPSRLNLIPKASVHGISEPLWFGTGIHYALERYYNPGISEDPAVAWEAWFDLQWRGGIVDETEIKQFVDRNPTVIPQETITQSDADGNTVWEGLPPTAYKVDGLYDILPNPDVDHFAEVKDLGVGMMNYYKDYAETHDNFTIISVEHDFSVPILDKYGAPLYMADNRLTPDDWEPDFDKGNEFGPLMMDDYNEEDGSPVVMKQVHARGRLDQIQQDNESGRFGILDHKTAGTIGDDYFRHLELDEQCTSYLAYGEVEAKIHGLEYTSLEYITYQALLKGYPKPPTITSRGLPSINRKEETTTAELFEACILKNGLKGIFDGDPKMQAYYAYLIETSEKRFVHRENTWRNKMQRKNAMMRLYFEAIDMLNDPVAYPNPTKNYGCLNCKFRTPCIQAEDGSDYLATLNDGFMENWDR